MPLDASLDLWDARESMQSIPAEFDLDRDAVERLVQDYVDRSRQRVAPRLRVGSSGGSDTQSLLGVNLWKKRTESSKISSASLSMVATW